MKVGIDATRAPQLCACSSLTLNVTDTLTIITSTAPTAHIGEDLATSFKIEHPALQFETGANPCPFEPDNVV